MTTWILAVGGVFTLLTLVNALLSFQDEGSTWASWFRLQVVIFPLLLIGLALQIAWLFR